MAGRGFGKNRAASEWLHQRVRDGHAKRIALLGRTAADVRDVIINGESGLFATARPDEELLWEPSKRKLTWPNGAFALAFSSDEPDQLRGPQFDTAVVDEFASFPQMTGTDGATAFDNLRMGMRMLVPSDMPRMTVTTTPRRVPSMFKLLEEATDPKFGIRVTRGSTYENLGNLAEMFKQTVLGLYEGTRLGRQELMGEMLADIEGALFQQEWFEETRVAELPLGRMYAVVGVDPSVAERPTDECGIVVVKATMERDYYKRHVYVVEDASVKGSPSVWAARVAAAARRWNAPIVAEGNQGGELVRMAIAQADSNLPVHIVHAKAGKTTRAEPVAALFEQRRGHIVGWLPELENQACLVAGTLVETARGHVPIEQVVSGDFVLTREGFAPVEWAGLTMHADTLTNVAHGGGDILCTPWHRIWTENRGFVPARLVQPTDLLVVRPSPASTVIRSHGGVAGTGGCPTGTIGTHRSVLQGDFSIDGYGRHIADRYQTGTSSITSITTPGTTNYPTWRSLRSSSTTVITGSMASVVGWGGPSSRDQRTSNGCGNYASPVISSASTAVSLTEAQTCGPVGARPPVGGRADSAAEPVYDIKVAEGYLPEFFANGILVHNSNWVAAESRYSPDRLDAMVHAVLALSTRQKGVTFALGRHLRARSSRGRLPAMNAATLGGRGNGGGRPGR